MLVGQCILTPGSADCAETRYSSCTPQEAVGIVWNGFLRRLFPHCSHLLDPSHIPTVLELRLKCTIHGATRCVEWEPEWIISPQPLSIVARSRVVPSRESCSTAETLGSREVLQRLLFQLGTTIVICRELLASTPQMISEGSVVGDRLRISPI